LLSKKHKNGFIWVELTIVIVILGILAVFVSSRFVTVFDSENVVASKAVTEAFEDSVNLVHLKWADQGNQGNSVAVNGLDVEVTSDGWVKQLNSNVAGCVSVWNELLQDSTAIAIYNSAVDVDGWSTGGGPGLCYFMNQNGAPFNEDETPYFSYSNATGEVSRFNM